MLSRLVCWNCQRTRIWYFKSTLKILALFTYSLIFREGAPLKRSMAMDLITFKAFQWTLPTLQYSLDSISRSVVRPAHMNEQRSYRLHSIVMMLMSFSLMVSALAKNKSPLWVAVDVPDLHYMYSPQKSERVL